MCRPPNDSHVGWENDLHIGVHDIFLKGRIVHHVEENGGHLGGPIARPAGKVAAAIGLDQQSNPLENFVQHPFH